MLKKANKALLIITAILVSVVMSCKKSESEGVVKPCDPPSGLTASNNSPVKVGDTLSFKVTSVSGATYTWYKTGKGAAVFTVQNPYIIFQQGMEGEYYVVVTSGGCASQGFYTYVSSAEFTASADSVVVTGKTLSLKAGAIFDNNNQIVKATYAWTGPNGFTSSLQNPTIANVTMAAAGDYFVTATIPGGVVSQQAKVTVVVKPAAVTTTTIHVTVGGTLTLTATTPVSGATSYHWVGPNHLDTVISQAPVFPNITRESHGEYTMSYVVNGVESVEGKVNVSVDFRAMGCQGDTVVVSGNDTIKVVEIGNQCWTKTNVNSAKSIIWDKMVVTGVAIPVPQQGACPNGYHIPNDSMWTSLANIVFGDGNALKATTEGTGAGKGTNTSGFSALLNMGGASYANFWSFSEVSDDVARSIKLFKDNNLIYFDATNKKSSLYVRCLRD